MPTNTTPLPDLSTQNISVQFHNLNGHHSTDARPCSKLAIATGENIKETVYAKINISEPASNYMISMRSPLSKAINKSKFFKVV